MHPTGLAAGARLHLAVECDTLVDANARRANALAVAAECCLLQAWPQRQAVERLLQTKQASAGIAGVAELPVP